MRAPHPRPTGTRRLTELGHRMVGLGLVLGLLATLTGSRVLLGAGAFALFLPVVTMLSLPGRHIEVTVGTPARSRVGTPVPVHVTVRNTGRRRLPPLELRWARPLFAARDGAIGPLLPGGSTVWTATAVPTNRGVSDAGRLDVVVPDLFGLSRRRFTIPAACRVLVGPRAVALPRPLPPAGDGPPLEPGDLRSWRPGDAASSVAWRSSARRSGGPSSPLVVRDRAPEQADAATLALSGGPPAELERALEVLAAAVGELSAQGRPVEVRLGRRPLGAVRMDLLLDELAALDVTEVDPQPTGGAPAGLTIGCRTAPRGPGPAWLVDVAGRVDVA